jgi:hypothetical protein
MLAAPSMSQGKPPLSAAIPPLGYREVVYPPVWASALVVAGIVLSVGVYVGFRDAVACETPEELWIWDVTWLASLAVLLGLAVLFGRLVIELGSDALVARFGFVSIGEARLPLTQIEAFEPVTYHPIGQFGGWGWRMGRHDGEATAAYSMRGSTGLLLRLRQPIRMLFWSADRVLIGSLRAAELGAALERVRR